jgi:hypothetical protein
MAKIIKWFSGPSRALIEFTPVERFLSGDRASFGVGHSRKFHSVERRAIRPRPRRTDLPRIKRDAIVLTGIDAGSPGDPVANGCRSSPCAVELLSPTCADPYGSTPSSTAGRDADLRGAPYGRLVRARAAGTPGRRCPIARLCSTGIAASRSLRPWSPGAIGQ